MYLQTAKRSALQPPVGRAYRLHLSDRGIEMTNVQFSSGVFVRGHSFQRGDLPLFVVDANGLPTSPYIVRYTIYYQPKQGCPIQAGPVDRTPVNVGVGEYYATGNAGECHQPGDWYVLWWYQESFGSERVELRYPFKIFDSSQFAVACATGPGLGGGTAWGGCGCQVLHGPYAWNCTNPCVRRTGCCL